MGPYAGMLRKLLEQNPALVRQLMGVPAMASPLRSSGMLPLQAMTAPGNTLISTPPSPADVLFRQQAEQAAAEKRKGYVDPETGRARATK